MQPNYVVAVLLIVHMTGILLYETWAIIYRGNDWTVSAVVSHWSRDFLIIPIIWGILTCHLFMCLKAAPTAPAKELIAKERPEGR